nr:hypothetical protein [Tanacetum cinerariifolium]
MILESVENGPLIWSTVEENGVTRTKKYAELSTAEKIQADCDMKATNIILQGLPASIYSLMNHYRVPKDLWERVQLLMQGDDPIACLNKAMAFLLAVASSSGYKSNATSSVGNNVGGQARVIKCYNCQGERCMARSRGSRRSSCSDNHSKQCCFQTKDLDTYDSYCDDISNVKAILMANISNYGSDVISERIKPTLYDGIVMSNKHVVMHVIVDEETSILEEDFERRFVPQQELSADKAFWYHMLNPSSKSSIALPVKIEAPKELPKVSLVNESLINLKLHLANFDKVVLIRTTPNA